MILKNTLTLVLLCLLAACASSETKQLKTASPSSNGEGLISRGDENLRLGNTLEAKRRYELALLKFQRSDDLKGIATTHLKLAGVCLLRNETESAGKNVYNARSIIEKETLGDLTTALAVAESSLFIATGRSAEAISLLQMAVQKKTSAKDPRILLAMGRAFLAENNLKESKKYFEAVLLDGKGGPFESAARVGIGRALYSMSDYKGSLTQLQTALALDKEALESLAVGDTLHLIGMVYESKSDNAKAVYYFRRALSVNLQTDLPERQKADRAAILRVERK